VSRASSETRIRRQRAVTRLPVAQGKSLSEAARLVGWKSYDPMTQVTRRFNGMGLCAPLRFSQAGASSKVWARRTGADFARSPPDSRPSRNRHPLDSRSGPSVLCHLLHGCDRSWRHDVRKQFPSRVLHTPLLFYQIAALGPLASARGESSLFCFIVHRVTSMLLYLCRRCYIV